MFPIRLGAVRNGMRRTIMITSQTIEATPLPFGHQFAFFCGIRLDKLYIACWTCLLAFSTSNAGVCIGDKSFVTGCILNKQGINDLGFQSCRCSMMGKITFGTALYLCGYVLDAARCFRQFPIASFRSVHIKSWEKHISIGHGYRIGSISLHTGFFHYPTPHFKQSSHIITAGAEHVSIILACFIALYMQVFQYIGEVFGQSP